MNQDIAALLHALVNERVRRLELVEDVFVGVVENVQLQVAPDALRHRCDVGKRQETQDMRHPMRPQRLFVFGGIDIGDCEVRGYLVDEWPSHLR